VNDNEILYKETKKINKIAIKKAHFLKTDNFLHKIKVNINHNFVSLDWLVIIKLE